MIPHFHGPAGLVAIPHFGFRHAQHYAAPHYGPEHAHTFAHHGHLALMNLADDEEKEEPGQDCDAKRALDPRDYECFCMEGDHRNPWKPHCHIDLNKPAPCDQDRLNDPNDLECMCYPGDQFNTFKPYCKKAYDDEMASIKEKAQEAAAE